MIKNDPQLRARGRVVGVGLDHGVTTLLKEPNLARARELRLADEEKRRVARHLAVGAGYQVDEHQLVRIHGGQVDPVTLPGAEVEDAARRRGRALANVMVDELVGATTPLQQVGTRSPVQCVGALVAGESVVVERALIVG